MTITPSALVKDIGGLVTLPDVYLRISRLIDDPNSSATDIAKAVSQDPSFTVRLLRVANSSLYSFPSAVATVAKAVSIIGTSQVRSLALSMSIASSFDGLLNELVSMKNFWRHSLFCALIARHLAKQTRCGDPDTVFTAGLLHDIGELVIFNRMPEQAKKALLAIQDSQDELPVYQAERQTIGFSHSEVGGAMAREWNLPPLLEECIAYHHDVAEAKRHPKEVALIHLANILALMAELDTLDIADVPPIDPLAWDLTKLDVDCVEPAVRAAQAEIETVEKMFI